jgi:hypothetical protein
LTGELTDSGLVERLQHEDAAALEILASEHPILHRI